MIINPKQGTMECAVVSLLVNKKRRRKNTEKNIEIYSFY